MPSLSVVVPMFNESPRLTEGVGTTLTHLSQTYPGCQVILVDDGSFDDTAAKAEHLLERFPEISGKLLRLVRTGKGGAVKAGMLQATGDVRVFLDADNATPIEELDRLLPMVKNDRTIVIGSRALDRSLLEYRQPWWREGMGRTFNHFLRLLVDLPYRDTQCGFKLFGRTAADACFSRQTVSGFAFDVELLWIARKERFTVLEVPVRWRHIRDSRVAPLRHSLQMAKDVIRIRLRN
jgi:dolichyl-phosphate beta-glucosyltransferase